VYFLYLDESGVQELNSGSAHFVLGGIAIPAKSWKAKQKAIENIKQ